MDETPKDIKSRYLSRPDIKKQFELLENVMEEGQKRVDWEAAHNEDVIKAIEIVERFLRKKHRICYGGQAINALLPLKHKFYDSRYTIPDYDFFSPSVKEDTEELTKMLMDAGLPDVTQRVGMHEGTMKVNVNFVPVADITEMNPDAFAILLRRAKKVDGILYCDPDFLRMNMHLELSRPRGQVDRWKKVYERLLLLNRAYPVPTCDERLIVKTGVHADDRREILSFCLAKKHPIAGIEAIALLEKKQSYVSFQTLIKIGGPVLFFSPNATLDAEDLKDRLSNSKSIHIETFPGLTDSLLTFTVLYRGKKPLALIAQETACHGYTHLTLDTGEEMRISLHDTLMHLYYNLVIFGKREKAFFQMSLDCILQKLYHITKDARTNPTKTIPAFGLRCSGRQKGMATLRKERLKRTNVEKKKNKTRKNK